MRAFTVSLFLCLSACGFSTPIEAQHPSVQKVPGSVDDSPEERHAALLATAKADLACSHVDVVVTLDRRYANSVAVRHLVEGCGKRALYIETCQAYPSCRYLVVSVLSLSTLGPEPAPAAAPPAAPKAVPPAAPTAPSGVTF